MRASCRKGEYKNLKNLNSQKLAALFDRSSKKRVFFLHSDRSSSLILLPFYRTTRFRRKNLPKKYFLHSISILSFVRRSSKSFKNCKFYNAIKRSMPTGHTLKTLRQVELVSCRRRNSVMSDYNIDRDILLQLEQRFGHISMLPMRIT